MAISPLSLVRDARPAALAGHVVDAARAIASEARTATRGAAFGDLLGNLGTKLDANHDGAVSPADGIAHIGRGAAAVFSALTGSRTLAESPGTRSSLSFGKTIRSTRLPVPASRRLSADST